MTDTPIHHWTMDNISGSSVIDEITGGENLTLSGRTQITGQFDYGLSVGQPTSQYLVLSADRSFKAVSIWIKRGDTSYYSHFGGKLDNSRLVEITNSDFLAFYNGSGNYPSNLVINDTDWHHVWIVEGSSNNYHWFWLDGVKASAEVQSNLGGVLGQFGRSNSATSQENCAVDNIQWYDRMPTDEEIAYLAAATVQTETLPMPVDLVPIRAVLHQPYALEIDGRRAILDQLYPLTNRFASVLEQVWGLRMLVALDMPYNDMPLKRAVLHMPLADCKPFRRSLQMEYGDARQYRAVLDNEWNLSAGLRAILVERYSISDHQVRGAFEQLYDLQDRDLLRAQLNQIYAMAAGLALVQRHEIEVTCDGQAITSMVNINIEQDEGLFHMSGELQLADQAEFLLFREYASEVTITVNDETFTFLPEKTRKSRPETGVNVYIVPLASSTLLNETPHSTSLTAAYSGMASSLVESLADPDTVDWQLVDWFIPPGRLAVTGESAITVIKRIVSAAGGVVQTSPAGVLVCRPEYPVSVNLWATAEPDIELTDQDDFFSLDPQPELRDGYNEFFISDQQLASGGLRKETEKTGDYTALIRVYQVPWDSKSIVRDYHSGGSWVSLIADGVVEETITEQVEILAGAGQVSKPCYQELSHDYRVVDLGELTITEAGEVTTATAGYSLLSITYTTRYWKFRATDYRDEDVQFYAEAI